MNNQLELNKIANVFKKFWAQYNSVEIIIKQ